MWLAAVTRLRPFHGTVVQPMETASGATLMNRGLSLDLKSGFAAAAVVLERIQNP